MDPKPWWYEVTPIQFGKWRVVHTDGLHVVANWDYKTRVEADDTQRLLTKGLPPRSSWLRRMEGGNNVYPCIEGDPED